MILSLNKLTVSRGRKDSQSRYIIQRSLGKNAKSVDEPQGQAGRQAGKHTSTDLIEAQVQVTCYLIQAQTQI